MQAESHITIILSEVDAGRITYLSLFYLSCGYTLTPNGKYCLDTAM